MSRALLSVMMFSALMLIGQSAQDDFDEDAELGAVCEADFHCWSTRPDDVMPDGHNVPKLFR